METTANLHMYFTDHLIIVPLTKDSLGLWVEVQPVIEADSLSLEDLVSKIFEYIRNTSELKATLPWDGNNGDIWNKASKFIGVRQYKDTSWKITPFIQNSELSTNQKDHIEWTPENSKAISINPSPEAINDIAKTIIRMIGQL